jgi:hypothetical protein
VEIRKVSRRDAELGAEGAVMLLLRLVPAIEHVDWSSGALGTAAGHAVDELIAIVAAAPVESETRSGWLEKLFEALTQDAYGFLEPVGDEWGRLCASPALAASWAERLVPKLERAWRRPAPGRLFLPATAALSSLLVAGRHEQLLQVLERAPRVDWSYRRYGVQALVALGRRGAALRYAEASRGERQPDSRIDRACESLLLASGLYQEAFRRYGLTAHLKPSRLATFRAVARTYPMLDPEEILRRLIAATPGEEGKWFVTAKELGLLDLALKLVRHSPTDPRSLVRAARDYRDREPEFAHGAAMACLRWAVEGYGSELTSYDALQAWALALETAEHLGRLDQTRASVRRLVAGTSPSAVWMRRVLAERLEA